MKLKKTIEATLDSDDGSDFFPCSIKNETPKRTNFDNFLKHQYSIIAAKYTFLSSQQIKKKIMDMWKKNPKLQENLDKTVKIKEKGKKQESFLKNKSCKESTKKPARQSSKGKVLVPLDVDIFRTPVRGVLKR
ncbi:hypothetical protein JTE90_022136 [Oedothorax gibbosus]|uniref:HMG box domain-containing protein n=1 Tax=Oedothorax gibbosus TaxID=931172 RepID=A0AAV6VUD2_9ARAC|nr:hypothetical protein JTE90_022136 [Oedothorax gibbosus]